MSAFKKLISEFATRNEVPVEINEIRDAVIKIGMQDKIVFIGKSVDTQKIWGAIYQYTTHSSPYAQPDLHTIIAYNTDLPVPWQRVVCCKELVHIFDRKEERTNTPEHVVELAEKILGPMSSEDFGFGDVMALKDKIALYQSLPLLFSNAARDAAISAISAGRKTEKSVAEAAALPVSLVKLMLSDEWPAIAEEFLKDC